MKESADLALAMASVSSALGLCSFCQDATARAYLSTHKHIVQQSREGFLNAQQKCYICTWIEHGLTSEALDALPQSFSISWFIQKRKETILQLEVSAINILFIAFSINSNAGTTHNRDYASLYIRLITPEFTCRFPPAVVNFHNTQLSTLAAHWIEGCRRNHQECTPIQSGFRPKRLVQIIDESHWKLVFARCLPRKYNFDYVALSHCWGGSTQLLKLVKDNEYQLQSQMPVATLPTTFKEAISACLGLKYQYLWIDSLCIIQDSPEDWQEQAAEMNLVYGNAVLSLCMAGSSTPSEASFQSRNIDLILPLTLPATGRDGEEEALHMICRRLFEIDFSESPLIKRGWVFQEWYLAKRSLIFGHMQLWWQCCEEFACETIPGGMSDTNVYQWHITEFREKKVRNLRRLEDSFFFDKHWWNLIEQYASTKLTEETKDRVVAFSGIARALGESRSIVDQYVAGMWRYQLPQSLLWFRYNSMESCRSLKGYKAPSWSWMSVDGPASLRNILVQSGREAIVSQSVENHCCCSFEQFCLSLVDKSNITGRLQGGFILVRGHLLGLHNGGVGNNIERKSSLGDFGWKFTSSKVIKWDETDGKGAAMASYLENITLEAYPKEISTAFLRTRVPLEHAKGSFFALPVLHQAINFGTLTERRVIGLVLYQPPHQPDVFHRVAFYLESDRPGLVGRPDKLDFTSFTDRLSQYPARSIPIF
jgi:hypothetical protein